jgi:hypothetical protein
VGYRPANQRHFIVIQTGEAAARIHIASNGDVAIGANVTNPSVFLSLEMVRFLAA